MKFSRRRFLGFTAGGAAGAALGVPAGHVIGDFMAATSPSVYPPRGQEDFVLSVCTLCPGGCGVRARRIGGRVVKLDGNPLYPVNHGRLCPKGQAALQALYHPDRAPGPLRRIGPRGSIDSFEPASWDEALDAIAGRLNALREAARPEGLVLMRGFSRGVGARLASRFMRVFGSPNDVSLHQGDDAGALALQLAQGVQGAPAYDLQSAEYVLSFGSALLEASSSPVHMMRAYGEFRQGRPGRRGKLVQVEPRLSITAASADEWIVVAPGTEGVLALGIAGALLAEGLHDREFVIGRTLGLEDHLGPNGKRREGVRTILERDYSLERVSSETGVPVNTILRVAREFAASRAPLALGPARGPSLPGPLFDHLAAQWLNALVGNVDQPGGVLVPESVPLRSWPSMTLDDVAGEALERPRFDGATTRAVQHHSYADRLTDVLLAEFPYPVEVLMAMGTDPMFATSQQDRMIQAFERIPLVVSFASIPDDGALHADWILPESHFLETWELDTTPPGVPFPMAGLSRPAVEPPMADVRPPGQILLELAKKVGGNVAAAFPWEDFPALIRSEVEGLYEARRGAVMGTDFDEAWVHMMERAGWWAPGYRSAEELWERMLENGGWWDPFYDHSNWTRVLRAPSGRYEFRTDELQRLAEERQAHQSRNRPSGESARDETAERNGLALLLFEPLPISAGIGAELPFLQQILDPGHVVRWQTWAEIHPETARSLGVGDGDSVRVESEHGSVIANARVTQRVVPGALAMPIGLGRRTGGRWARGVGANPVHLLSPSRDPLGVEPGAGGTRVKVAVIAKAAATRPLEGQV